jgi:hypothetical protein
MKQIKQATIVVPCKCSENKSGRHSVSVPEAVPTRIFCALFASNLLTFWQNLKHEDVHKQKLLCNQTLLKSDADSQGFHDEECYNHRR